MPQKSVIITLGIIQMIIMTLFGLYFYRLKHVSTHVPVVVEEGGSLFEEK